MPIPVSATEKTAVPSLPGVALTWISPRSVNFSALEMKLRRICETLLSSVCSIGTPTGSSKIRLTALL